MELVVLVDEQNNPIAAVPKDKVHTQDTPLHRAFSLFLFTGKKELLLTKRAASKKTFPGVWTNTVCGHPRPGESEIDAAARRLKDELGITGVEIKEVAPYRYRATDAGGIVENEICPILVGYYDGDPIPNPQEIDDWKRMNWHEFLKETRKNPIGYSPWSIEEAAILQQKDPALH